jgi:hypothetical protein
MRLGTVQKHACHTTQEIHDKTDDTPLKILEP